MPRLENALPLALRRGLCAELSTVKSRRLFEIARSVSLSRCVFACVLLNANVAQCAITAADNASNSAYAFETGGAWNGLYPTADENPPGMDNGGFGFNAWDFFGGFHQPTYSPYGRLNHFMTAVDFATTSFNNLGSPAFALTNSNFDPTACGEGGCAFGGETSRATRSFATPLTPGDTFSVNFDNPLLSPEVLWYPAGFLMRLNTGGGPVVPNHPTTSATERFGLFASTGTYGGPGLFGDNWGVADATGNTDTGVNVSATASGAELRFTLVTNETYSMELKRLSDGGLLFSRSGSLSATGVGPIDTIEIALFGNGSGNGLTGASMHPTGEREFYFNNLQIESATTGLLPGDYNRNGIVDAADYVIWRKSSGQSVPNGSGADGDNNGTVNGLDYDIWRTHFGTSGPGSAAAVNTVPEPSCFVEICMAFFPLEFLRRCGGEIAGIATTGPRNNIRKRSSSGIRKTNVESTQTPHHDS